VVGVKGGTEGAAKFSRKEGKPMQREAVSSSRIRSIGWEPEMMEVEFHDGAVYQYFCVTNTDYATFMSAPSLGSELSRFDKVHPYRRVR